VYQAQASAPQNNRRRGGSEEMQERLAALEAAWEVSHGTGR